MKAGDINSLNLLVINEDIRKCIIIIILLIIWHEVIDSILQGERFGPTCDLVKKVSAQTFLLNSMIISHLYLSQVMRKPTMVSYQV